MMKRELYSVENDKISRQRRFCPRCGPGVFLAEHPNRYSCGKCGYTETKKEGSKAKPQADTKKESGKGKNKK